MDRLLVYPGSIPLDTDILNVQRYGMEAIGFLTQAMLGTGTVVSGLACTPTAPASMTVNVGPGSIMSLQTVDSSSFGSLTADSTDPLVKMGINLGTTPFTLTAPVVSGQSINYLIEANFSEADNTPVTLPYFNAANPTQPFSGPANSGTPQNTVRAQRVSLQLKAGTPANTGTQATPAVDSGWTGLWVISVAFGASTVTSGNIVAVTNAPFLAPHLASHHGGVPGQAPKINLATEVTGVLPLANMVQVRTPLFTNTTFYVNGTTGSDTNNGLTTGTAFRTIQACINAIYTKYDFNGFTGSIQVADGTYTFSGGPNSWAAIFSGMPFGYAAGGILSFVGNNVAPGNVIINSTNGNGLTIQSGALVSVSGFTITAAGTNTGLLTYAGYGINVQQGFCTVNGPLTIGSCGSAQIQSSTGAIFSVGTGFTLTLTGTTPNSLLAAQGLLWIIGSTINVTGLTVTSGFAVSSILGQFTAGGNTFIGSATGPRYLAFANSVISTQAGGANYFPGSSAGSSSAGGQYF